MIDPERKERPLPAGLLIQNPIVIVDSVGQRRGEGEETKIPQRGYSNRTEAETIVDMIEHLLRCVPGTTATSIGISAPYKMQILLIQDLMRTRRSWPPGFKLDQVLIATADAFQGSEREFMFVSTVRTSYQGLKFAASLRRINVILSRGSIATFFVSNSRVFGRSDLGTGQKYKSDAKEGIEAIRHLFEWQGGLKNIYTLDTWRRIFNDSIHQITMVGEDIVGMQEERGKNKWEKLYYQSWRTSILGGGRPATVWTSMEQIEESWKKFRMDYLVANIRRILSDMMAYCTHLWVDNILATMGGPNPERVVRDNNTVLTVQNSEVPVKGWPHRSYQRYPLLLLTILLNGEATGKNLYRKQTTMLGIERGQRGEIEKNQTTGNDEWLKVSGRSVRGMMSMTTLNALALGLFNRKEEESEEIDGEKVSSKKMEFDTPLSANGHMICIRLGPLCRLWGRNDRKNWEPIRTYLSHSEGGELGVTTTHLKWRMIVLYRYKVHLEIKESAKESNHNRLMVTLMTRLNCTRVRKEFRQHPCVLKKKEERSGPFTGRQLYLKRRWRNVWFRNSWKDGEIKANVPHYSKAWKDQIERHPWYRYIPLITRLATWETFGLRYLPTSSKEEMWMEWPDPEFKKDTEKEKKEGIKFYDEAEVHDWWSHIHIINRREAMRWLLYSRQDHRWHHSTGAWAYYLGKIPGLKNQKPRTILHSRERAADYQPQGTSMGWNESQRYSVYNGLRTKEEMLITERDWDRHCGETCMTRSHCQQLWPNTPGKGPGCNSLGNSTWITISKEDALEEQRKLCERTAYHKMGEHRDGHFSRTKGIHIISPYARQEHNLPLFPDHEANMALRGIREPDGWKYIIRAINPGLPLSVGKCPVETWLNNGLTPALMQINPPGFVSGPSQSSEVTYSQPEEGASTQSRMRLLLRDLSRSHDVVQGIAVAKKYEDMSRLLGTEVLNQIGPLNHPAP